MNKFARMLMKDGRNPYGSRGGYVRSDRRNDYEDDYARGNMGGRRDRDMEDYATYNERRMRDYEDDYRRDRNEDYRRRDYGKPEMFSHKDMETWKSMMKNEDGTRGEHFRAEQVKHACQQAGIDCEEFGEDVVLTTADNKIFKIQYVDEQFNGEKIEEICNGDAAVITYSEEVTPKDGDDYFALDAIKYDNNYILTFGETHRLYKQENFPVIIFAIVFVLAVFGLIIGTIIVGRNPQRYSKRVVRMFFKDGYINY